MRASGGTRRGRVTSRHGPPGVAGECDPPRQSSDPGPTSLSNAAAASAAFSVSGSSTVSPPSAGTAPGGCRTGSSWWHRGARGTLPRPDRTDADAGTIYAGNERTSSSFFSRTTRASPDWWRPASGRCCTGDAPTTPSPRPTGSRRGRRRRTSFITRSSMPRGPTRCVRHTARRTGTRSSAGPSRCRAMPARPGTSWRSWCPKASVTTRSSRRS